MRVLVYPHDLEMGGSQMNAIEIAAQMRELGVEPVLFGRPGALNGWIAELGLEFRPSPEPSHRPSARVARALRDLARERRIDVLHGYEWPPTLEVAWAAGRLPGVAPVSTVMSMAVAPFIPAWMTLVVGTRQIAAAEQAAGRPRVHLLEPPVDLVHNVVTDPAVLRRFRATWKLDGRPLLVCVTRLARELKSEGIFTAIEVARAARGTDAFQLLIVGDGPERARVEAAAAEANAVRANTVVLTGQLDDPRPAYAVADVCLGMGGSALRALAFGKPLIVQGEQGFFLPLTPETVRTFRWQGWYGIGEGISAGPARLRAALNPLLRDVRLRSERSALGSEVVRAFSLERAAETQVAIYRAALEGAVARGERLADGAAATVRFGAYHVRRRAARRRGHRAADDFNASPVAAAPPSRRRHPGAPGAGDGSVVYFPGVSWDAVPGTDRALATALSETRDVMWVDPPMSVWARWRRRVAVPAESRVAPRVTRLSVAVPPGVTRPGARAVVLQWVAFAVRRRLRASGVRPSAVIASTTEAVLPSLHLGSARLVYFATDDFVAGAPLWGVSARYLHRAREANLRHADLVLAVTEELAQVLRREGTPSAAFSNGCDLGRYAGIETVHPAADVHLAAPIAGVVGQFNERTDLRHVRAVVDAGVSVLLVGPRYYGSRHNEAALEDLCRNPRVQWIDRVTPDRLVSYMRCLDVGLTPYADTVFNRRSFPLKTLDYLAAGIPVVTTAVPPMEGLDTTFVRRATTPADFADAVLEVLRQPPARSAVREAVRAFDWPSRARQLDEWLTGGVHDA